MAGIWGKCSYRVEVGRDALGNMQRISNALARIPEELKETKQKLENVQRQLAIAKEEVEKPFVKEAELQEKLERLAELNVLLNMDEKSPAEAVGLDGEDREADDIQDIPERDMEEDIEKKLPETAGKIIREFPRLWKRPGKDGQRNRKTCGKMRKGMPVKQGTDIFRSRRRKGDMTILFTGKITGYWTVEYMRTRL